jgi:hypothetical protein
MLLNEKQRIHHNQVEVYENTIRDLRRELENALALNKELKEKASEPTSLLMHLQKELIDLKVRRLFACDNTASLAVVFIFVKVKT